MWMDGISLSWEREDNKVRSRSDQLKERFETVNLEEELHPCSAWESSETGPQRTILSEQEGYANAVLDKFGMAERARVRPTTSEAGPLVPVLEGEVLLSAEDTTPFRPATGSFLYLSRCTRPDITHSLRDMVLTRSTSTATAVTVVHNKVNVDRNV